MQKPQESATKTKTQGLGCFRLELQCSIVQLQAIQRLAQIGIIVCIGGKQTGKDPGLQVFEPGQRLHRAVFGQGNRVTDRSAVHILDAGNKKSHFTGGNPVPHHAFGCENANLLYLVLIAG